MRSWDTSIEDMTKSICANLSAIPIVPSKTCHIRFRKQRTTSSCTSGLQ